MLQDVIAEIAKEFNAFLFVDVVCFCLNKAVELTGLLLIEKFFESFIESSKS
jgi:hypothetical protein